jgi:hypothetical protein
VTTASTHDWLRRVSDYHSGDVEAAEAAAVEGHLAGCEDCRQALAVYRRFYVLASSPLHLDEQQSIVAERPTLRTEISSGLTARDALERHTYPRRGRRLERNRRLIDIAAVLAASLIIVGFLAVLGWRIGGVRGHATLISSGPSSHPSTVPPYSTANVPVTPIATAGPQSYYVSTIVTAQGVSENFVPINQTSHFQVDHYVYVICDVHRIPKGQNHTISIHWFYDNQDLDLPSTLGATYQIVASNQVVYFRLYYPYPGLGMAKIFVDLPSGDSGDQASNPYLAGEIYFAIDPANLGAGTPAATRSASPTV